jgi:hypothetical protein
MSKDAIIDEFIKKGIMDETEIPFDETDNEFEEEKNEEDKYKLPYTIKLDREIKLEKTTISEIIFQNELSIGNIMHLSIEGNFQWGHFVPVIADMTGLSRSIVKKLSPRDGKKALEVIVNFLL